MSYLFAAFVAVSAFLALSNWRTALVLITIITAIRDPIRKLTPGEPVWITHVGLAVWVGVFIGCLGGPRQIRAQLLRMFPGIKSAYTMIILAVVPAALMSLMLYSNGWVFALIGGVSYLAPIPGALVGVLLARKPVDFIRFCAYFCIIHAVAMTGGIAEYLHWNWPALGGLNNFNWVRQQHGVWVEMVGGFYRSPDISGFFCAHVMIFSLLLAIPRRERGAPIVPWLFLSVFAALQVFLSGRRKMMAIPLVFIGVLIVLSGLRRRGAWFQMVGVFGLAAGALAGSAWLFLGEQEDLNDHSVYASTAFGEILPKIYNHTLMGSLETVRQSGILGSGLGVATQGAHRAGQKSSTRAWQEDGVSRLFKELGVPGTLLVFAAMVLLLKESMRAFRFGASDWSRQILQDSCLAVVAADTACFVISHQHMSGDPMNAMIPLLFLGGFFGQAFFSRYTQVPLPPGKLVPNRA